MLIYGAGGHAIVVQEIAELLGRQITSFIDDNLSLKTFNGIKVIHKIENINIEEEIIIAIGNNAVREKIAKILKSPFITLISPQAYISQSALIEEGSVISHHACIQAKVSIGKHAIVNTGAVIEHESIIENYCHISSNATILGNTRIGKGSFIDAGAVVGRNLIIGENVRIGQGASVTQNLPDNSEVF